MKSTTELPQGQMFKPVTEAFAASDPFVFLADEGTVNVCALDESCH